MINAAVLVLNQNYEPLNVCDIRRAFRLLGAAKAELLQRLDEGLVADRRLGIGVRLDRARGQQILAEQDQHHGADERKAADREEPDDRPLREDRRRRHAAAPPNTTSSQR